jgi:anti-sigma-K factor RskA
MTEQRPEEGDGPEDIQMLAGEYVLGTLPRSERQSVSARRVVEPALEAAILAWEAELAPLAEMTPETEAPNHLFAEIERRLFGATPLLETSSAEGGRADPARASAEIIDLRRRANRWRIGCAISSALAASLLIVIGMGWMRQQAEPTSFVAMLQKDASSPAFLVSVNIAERRLSIRPVAAERQTGKSYELWLVNTQFPAPRSLGIVHDADLTTGASLAAYTPDTVRNSVLAVSLEPEGGSPTGAPTGPVLFTGKLVALQP